MGGIVYGPYAGTWFESTSQTDIEHIIARSEAHDSGLCAADAATKRRFASDLLNLTLASPSVNRSQKSGKDAAEWLPDLNQCWFASRVVEVRQRYGLTIDRREGDVLEVILSSCTSTTMGVDRSGALRVATPTPDPGSGSDVQCPAVVRRQRERSHHLRGGTGSRHCAGPPRPSGLPVHGRSGQRRSGVRVKKEALVMVAVFAGGSGAAMGFPKTVCRPRQMGMVTA